MIIPFLQYVDANQAIEWLEKAFGFKRHLLVPDGQGGVSHSQLLLGDSMIMVSSIKDDRVPDHTDRLRGIYVVVNDPDQHYQIARQQGAEMIMDIEDQDYGGRAYTCLDCEGYLWSFGSYDPFAS